MFKRFFRREFNPLRFLVLLAVSSVLLIGGVVLGARIFRSKDRDLKFGMNFAEVKLILGEPEGVLVYDEDHTRWQYKEYPPLEFRNGFLYSVNCKGGGNWSYDDKNEWYQAHPNEVKQWELKDEHKKSRAISNQAPD